MGNVRLYGSTSGYTELAPPAVAPDGVLSLPSGTGTLATLADVAAGGEVLQVVRATDSTQRSTTSTSFTDVTGMAVTITPQVATSNVLVIAIGTYQSSRAAPADTGVNYQITNSSNTALSGAEIALSGTFPNLRVVDDTFMLFGWVSPGVTTAVTYKLRFSSNTTDITNRCQNQLRTGQIFAIEVAA